MTLLMFGIAFLIVGSCVIIVSSGNWILLALGTIFGIDSGFQILFGIKEMRRERNV